MPCARQKHKVDFSLNWKGFYCTIIYFDEEVPLDECRTMRQIWCLSWLKCSIWVYWCLIGWGEFVVWGWFIFWLVFRNPALWCTILISCSGRRIFPDFRCCWEKQPCSSFWSCRHRGGSFFYGREDSGGGYTFRDGFFSLN